MQGRFKQVTKLFYQGQYQQGFTKIHQLSKQQPQNPILHVNKGLFLSQIGKQEQAIKCLQRSLRLNPINYVAYFNLFSIQTCNNQDEGAFSNLCCALSVMYLIRGRITKDTRDLHKAIEFSSNNIEAYVLCTLLELQNKEYERAKFFLENGSIQISKYKILKHLYNEICRKIDPEYTESHYRQTIEQIDYASQRLNSSLKASLQTNLIHEIEEKLKLFNDLYNQINGNLGGVTQKVPKQSSFLNNNIETFMLQKSKVKSNQSVIAVLQDQEYFTSATGTAESKLGDQRKMQQNMGQAAQSLVTAYQSNRNKDISVIEEAEQDRLSMQSQPTHYSHSSKLELYPCDFYTKFKLNLIKLSLFDYQQSKPLQAVYCILSYGSTKTKMITSPMPCNDGECLWNKMFDDLQLQKQPATMKLKVYNKKRTQIRDQFIGELQVLLITCDLLKLPIFNRKGEQVGNILLHVQLNRISND